MRSTRAILLAVVVFIALTVQYFSVQAAAVHSIGYIGCSNSEQSVTGYHTIAGNANLLWPAYATGGGIISEWATPTSSFWKEYDQMVTTEGQPTKVWVQLCEKASTQLNTYSDVQAMLSNLKQHSPNATVYISAINQYNPPTLCRLMGTNGRGYPDTVQFAATAVAQGLAYAGPKLGPLDSTLVVPDGCHMNTAGETLIGQQMVNFFDAPKPGPTSTPTGAPSVRPTNTPTRGATATPTLISSLNLTAGTSRIVDCKGTLLVASRTVTSTNLTCNAPTAQVTVAPGALVLVVGQSLNVTCQGIQLGVTKNSNSQVTLTCN